MEALWYPGERLVTAETPTHAPGIVSLEVVADTLTPVAAALRLGETANADADHWGKPLDGVRVLVMCGRDEANASVPTFDQVYSQLNEERINVRARRYLRDLRRDAVIEFR